MYMQPHTAGDPPQQAELLLPPPVLAPFGVVQQQQQQRVLPPPGFPPLPTQRPLQAPSPIYTAAPPTYGEPALPAAGAAAYTMPSDIAAGYSSVYGVHAAPHGSMAGYGGDDSRYHARAFWQGTQGEAQHAAQHDAAALCEALVVYQQLAELQLLHEKISHCLLCMQQPRSAVMLPCKHLAVCNECCKQFVAGAEAVACPLCGVEVLDAIDGVRLPT
jgi:hypothetical protein